MKKQKCDTCKKVFDKQLTNFDGQLWCEDCLTESTTLCHDCGARIYTSDAYYTADDYPICERCYDEHYFCCDGCGRVYHYDYCVDGYCEWCDVENGHSRPQACPDNKRYYSKSRWDLPVGVEIEAENGDYYSVYDDLAPNGFGVQEDGSLNGSGIEVQIPASNGGNTEKLISQACSTLSQNGFGISKRCGLHIHIEYPSRMKTIKRLLLMAYACEPIFYAVNPQSRKNSSYCQALNLAFKAGEIIRAKPQDIDKLFYSKRYFCPTKSKLRQFKRSKWNSCRYFGFNLHSLFHQNTVEFRYHGGTLSAEKITRWLKLLT